MAILSFGSFGCACCAYTAFAPTSSRAVPVKVSRFSTALTAGSSEVQGGALCLNHASIINPRDGSILPDMSILVKNGSIVDVVASGGLSPDPSVQQIDAQGKFVVPGYNDMHNHAYQCADASRPLSLMLADGVTGFRQMGGSPGLLAQRRNNALKLDYNAPAMLEAPGEVLTPLNAGTIEFALAQVQAQKSQGADFIKIVFLNPDVFFAVVAEAKRLGIPTCGHLQEGTSSAEASLAGFRSVEHLGPGSAIWVDCSTQAEQLRAEAAKIPPMKAPSMHVPVLRSFIKWVAARKFREMVVNPLIVSPPEAAARLRRAVESFSPARAQKLAERFVADESWQVATLVRLRAMELQDLSDYDTDPLLAYMSPKALRTWDKVKAKYKALPAATRETFKLVYPRQMELAKLFADAGVRMMTGSDGGSMFGPGLTLQQEFGELAKAGISLLKILQMTTINAAEYLGRSHRMGTVEIGRHADFVLLDDNPLEAVENFGKIAAVVRAGHYHSAGALKALRARAAQAAKAAP